jgi:hypothetical protein
MTPDSNRRMGSAPGKILNPESRSTASNDGRA